MRGGDSHDRSWRVSKGAAWLAKEGWPWLTNWLTIVIVYNDYFTHLIPKLQGGPGKTKHA